MEEDKNLGSAHQEMGKSSVWAAVSSTWTSLPNPGDATQDISFAEVPTWHLSRRAEGLRELQLHLGL